VSAACDTCRLSCLSGCGLWFMLPGCLLSGCVACAPHCLA
jgi:hypothetical protein